MRQVTAEITWLVRLLDDLSAPPTLPVPLHSDSQAAIHIARNPVFHERTKDVELDSQLTDFFIKPLSGVSHTNIMSKLRVLSLPTSLRGDDEEKKTMASSQPFLPKVSHRKEKEEEETIQTHT
uniref:Uncharacterized protein n=1 Tax=Nicotiana tabacum TaxID=4097 RepID=A0A1S4DMR0_TOBAC|nr:PREDICTED: uncharacterized protein LOC107831454 [Nicotiana tabacum]